MELKYIIAENEFHMQKITKENPVLADMILTFGFLAFKAAAT